MQIMFTVIFELWILGFTVKAVTYDIWNLLTGIWLERALHFTIPCNDSTQFSSDSLVITGVFLVSADYIYTMLYKWWWKGNRKCGRKAEQDFKWQIKWFGLSMRLLGTQSTPYVYHSGIQEITISGNPLVTEAPHITTFTAVSKKYSHTTQFASRYAVSWSKLCIIIIIMMIMIIIIHAWQKTAILGTSHIIQKVLQCEAWSLSWFKRSTGKKRPVTRDIHIYNNNNNNNNMLLM